MVYFIADTHFGHSKIIEYEHRPFCSVLEMDRSIIKLWNQSVKPNDIIFILGDLTFHNFEDTKNIVSKLHGKKILIRGNHDKQREAFYLNSGIHKVYDFPIIYNDFWMLSHKPMYTNSNMPYANIFGHVHTDKAYTDYSSQTFCVSVERIGYKPISFDEIKKHMKKAEKELNKNV